MALDARRLADDSLMGRLAGSEGAQAAARYIADRCAELGLAPVNGAYLHPIPIRRTAIGPQTRLTIRRGAVKSFTAPSDVVPDRGSSGALRGFAGVTAYVGTSQSITAGGLGNFEIHERVAVSAGLLSPDAKDTLLRRGATGSCSLQEARMRSTDFATESDPTATISRIRLRRPFSPPYRPWWSETKWPER